MDITALVLRDEPDIAIPTDPVPVYVDFDHSRPPIGTATLRRADDGHVYADMRLREDIHGTPAIGYRNGQILTVSICASGNVDPLIPTI